MRTLGLLLAILGVPLLLHAQEPALHEGAYIESAEVTGLALDQLSPELRHDIEGLAGERLSRERVGALVARIEAEHPEVVAAVRDVLQADGRVRLIFLVARISDDPDLVTNINTRYVVESVEVEGAPNRDVGPEIWKDLQALIGRRLDSDEADRLQDRLREALPGYQVSRQISRGSEAGHIRVVFEVRRAESSRLLPFVPTTSKFVYHTEQGWSGLLDVPLGDRDNRVTIRLAGGNNDDLIEEYSGYGVRFESRRAGSDHLGVSLEWSQYQPDWHAASLAAIDQTPYIPAAYRERSTITPVLTFAFNRHLRVSGGVSSSELKPLTSSDAGSYVATAAIGSIGYRQRWDGGDRDQRVAATFVFTAGTDALGSDVEYRRYLGTTTYEYQRGESQVIASGMAGHITGQAPLFERFSLGDSTTLRGWDKYVIAPAGADSITYGSLEYRSHQIAFFLDVGSLWDRGTHAQVRVSTGVGIHTEHAFLTLGVPVNSDHVRGMFMLGIRW